ncbi:MAG: hypothetical protein SynsKO_00880 [Synoicihabitans sp.]
MKSFTIHKLDPALSESLERRAQQEGKSINQTVKILLSEKLGLTKPSPVDHRADFEDLAGAWSEAEARQLDERVNASREIDQRDWDR